VGDTELLCSGFIFRCIYTVAKSDW